MKEDDPPLKCPPRADAMIQSMRSVGYDIGMAIADLIDNSISAGAKNIWIGQNWDRIHSIISIMDDGKGMDEEVIFNAMRLGSMNPLDVRNPNDLGRFGMGLKTASFSQCRLLTVRSKLRSGLITTRCWDLDYVNTTKDWDLLIKAYPSSENYLDELNTLKSGTLVLWEKMDRLINQENQTDEEVKDDFLRKIVDISNYLGMIFHRYIGKGKLNIFIKNSDPNSKVINKVVAWDPFMSLHPATLELSNEAHTIFGKSIKVKPYILPHISKLNPGEHLLASGPKGWNAQQGFYIYRKERLIVSGGWLDLGYKAEDHYKLARIVVDIPNSMDHEWQLDVKKATAKPPDCLRKNFFRIAKLTRDKASEVYRFRGKVSQRKFDTAHQFVWKKNESGNKIRYIIDKDHPVIKSLLEQISSDKKTITKLLSLIESTVPIETIIITNSEHPDSNYSNKEYITSTKFPVKDLFEEQIEIYLKRGKSAPETFDQLLSVEPFNHYPELIALLENYEN